MYSLWGSSMAHVWHVCGNCVSLKWFSREQEKQSVLTFQDFTLSLSVHVDSTLSFRACLSVKGICLASVVHEWHLHASKGALPLLLCALTQASSSTAAFVAQQFLQH